METNFDKVINHVRRVTEKGYQAIVFLNTEGQPSVSHQVNTIFSRLERKFDGWKNVIGVYDENHQDWMIDEDLTYMGFTLK
jgi:hypothetical protein